MDETKTIGDYTVTNSMYIGHRDIVIGENRNAGKDERYMCCYVERTPLFERYTDVLVSDDFAEIAKVFGNRIAEAAEEILKETTKAEAVIGENEEITAELCRPITSDDSLENRVVAIRGEILRPEFRYANHQLMLCTGGFGGSPNSRGRTCFCTSLYDGRQMSYYRSDILGTVEAEKLPSWAKEGLTKAREVKHDPKQKERGEAR